MNIQGIQAAIKQAPGYFSTIEDSSGKVRGYLLGSVHVLDYDVMRKLNLVIGPFIKQATHVCFESHPKNLLGKQITLEHIKTRSASEKEAVLALYESFFKNYNENVRIPNAKLGVNHWQNNLNFLLEKGDFNLQTVKDALVNIQTQLDAAQKVLDNPFRRYEKIQQKYTDPDEKLAAYIRLSSKYLLEEMRVVSFELEIMKKLNTAQTIVELEKHPDIEPFKNAAEVLISSQLSAKTSVELMRFRRALFRSSQDFSHQWEADTAKAFETIMQTNPDRESLLKRNRIQADAIHELITDPNKVVFAVAGFAHMPAPGGVIDLLQQRGWVIKPIQK
jgi:uncharacterized protein YbaP (TraB family)